MTTANLFDHLGRPIHLGQKLGTGGEGAVFEIATTSDLVAKVYHKPPAARTEAKLRTMVGLLRDELVRVAAWPTATLHERPGGPAVGLVMRRIKDFKEIHTLYSPAHRKTTFPRADWRFLVTTAMNCSAAMENLHICGVVVGDVNQSNVLVSAAGLIALIDCDSFQIQSNGQTYPCEVGVPLFTPPDLQGQNFRGLNRTANHDRFGLAVLIFHLLFMGRHPFAGRFLGRGEMPIEEAIKQYRFAYGRSARSYEMQTPLHALPLSAVSLQLVELFERAFTRGASQGNTRPTGADWYNALKGLLQTLRPCSADQGHVYASHLPSCPWCNLMKQGAPNFFISVAYYRQGASQTGPIFVLATVWARIEQVSHPNLTYQPPVVPRAGHPHPFPPGVPVAVPPKPAPPPILISPPSPPPVRVPASASQPPLIPADTLQWTVGIVAGASGLVFAPFLFCVKPIAVVALIAFVAFGLWWGVLEVMRRMEMDKANRLYEVELDELRAAASRQRQEWEDRLATEQANARRHYAERLRPWEQTVAAIRREAEKRRRTNADAEQRLQAAESNWVTRASWYGNHFEMKKAELRTLRERHDSLAREYTAERQGLQFKAREMQLAQFLQQHFISDHVIPDIGPTRKATLASFGIETALDVEPATILQVPGFGPKLTDRLTYWREEIERQFVFNAAVGVPPQEQQALDLRFAQARKQVEARLLSGEGELRAIVNQAESELRLLYSHVQSCLQSLVQSELDLKLLPQGV
jgi:DNA-binding helix-hairpin-helix protein with protein kinase domain